MKRCPAHRLGARLRPRLRMRSCCSTSSDSATTERRPPGRASRMTVTIKTNNKGTYVPHYATLAKPSSFYTDRGSLAKLRKYRSARGEEPDHEKNTSLVRHRHHAVGRCGAQRPDHGRRAQILPDEQGNVGRAPRQREPQERRVCEHHREQAQRSRKLLRNSRPLRRVLLRIKYLPPGYDKRYISRRGDKRVHHTSSGLGSLRRRHGGGGERRRLKTLPPADQREGPNAPEGERDSRQVRFVSEPSRRHPGRTAERRGGSSGPAHASRRCSPRQLRRTSLVRQRAEARRHRSRQRHQA